MNGQLKLNFTALMKKGFGGDSEVARLTSQTTKAHPGSLLSTLSFSEKERREKQSPSLANDGPTGKHFLDPARTNATTVMPAEFRNPALRLEFAYLIVKEQMKIKVGALLFMTVVLASFLNLRTGRASRSRSSNLP
ncbi:hypothetical protein DL770_009432 [Monosporascus sp. CRB-9-2]|nr:hypothetical protein DL770_009432 [Monosporascus sp. CRB-9-2]